MAKTMQTTKRPHSDPTRLGQTFKRRLRAGELLIGGMVLEYIRPSLIKLYRHAGFDFIYIENEHAMFMVPELADFILSARDNGMPVIAKTGQLERAEVARLLEAGVVGIQLPRTETREQLLELIDVVKFPPLGTRAGAPCYGNVDYIWPADSRAWLKNANASTAIVAHIETVLGYENAEAIITTSGLDMVYVGQYDLSISLGYPDEYDHPKVKKPVLEILSLCKKHKVPFGTTASGTESARKWIAEGCQFFEAVDELSLILTAGSHLVSSYRQTQ